MTLLPRKLVLQQSDSARLTCIIPHSLSCYGLEYRNGVILKMSQESLFPQEVLAELTCSAEESPVSLIALPESVEDLLMSAISGRSSQGSFASLGPAGHWLKTCRGYLVQTLGGSLEEYSQTWPRWGMMRDGVCTELTPSVRRTEGKGCLSWPTPRAGKTTDEEPEAWTKRQQKGEVSTPPLTLAVRIWRTPQARDYKNARNPEKWQSRERQPGLNDMVADKKSEDPAERNGQLNPDWVECLVGLPIGWTAIDGPLDRESHNTNGSRRE